MYMYSFNNGNQIKMAIIQNTISPRYLHLVSNWVTIGQKLREFLCSKDVPERRLSDKVSGRVGILNVDDGHGWVVDAVKDDGIHTYSHAVLGQDLETKE